MAVPSAAIEMSTDLLAVDSPDVFHRGDTGFETVDDDCSRCAAALHGFLQNRKAADLSLVFVPWLSKTSPS